MKPTRDDLVAAGFEADFEVHRSTPWGCEVAAFSTVAAVAVDETEGGAGVGVAAATGGPAGPTVAANDSCAGTAGGPPTGPKLPKLKNGPDVVVAGCEFGRSGTAVELAEDTSAAPTATSTSVGASNAACKSFKSSSCGLSCCDGICGPKDACHGDVFHPITSALQMQFCNTWRDTLRRHSGQNGPWLQSRAYTLGRRTSAYAAVQVNA